CPGELEGPWLPEDKGELDGDDDVIVNCGTHFERLPCSSSPLRGAPKCQQDSTPERGTSDAGAVFPANPAERPTTQQPIQGAASDAQSDSEPTSAAHGLDAGHSPTVPTWGRVLDGSVLTVNEPHTSDAAVAVRPTASGKAQSK